MTALNAFIFGNVGQISFHVLRCAYEALRASDNRAAAGPLTTSMTDSRPRTGLQQIDNYETRIPFRCRCSLSLQLVRNLRRHILLLPLSKQARVQPMAT